NRPEHPTSNLPLLTAWGAFAARFDDQLPPQARGEPFGDRFESKLPVGHLNDEIVDAFIVRNVEDVPTSRDENLDQKPGGPLVAIDKTVVSDDAVQDGCGLPVHCAMIARIWPGKRGLDQMKAADAAAPAVT